MTVSAPNVETPANLETPVEETDDVFVWRNIVQKIMAGASVATAFAGTQVKAGPFQGQVIIDQQDACPVPINGPGAEYKLAHKATFGYHSGVEQDIVNMGYTNWLNDQLDYTNVSGWAAFETNLANTYPAITYAEQSQDLCCGNFNMRKMRRQELQKARVIRAAESPAQLYERVVEFWTDHLNTFVLTPNLNRMKILEDREVIRANALGRLKDMIYASATSPAMLIYLDGNSNTKNKPNENYARELLELHTLGANVCYTEPTIQELAKALTGWKVDVSVDTSPTCTGGPYTCGAVTFNNNDHDNTSKVLDFTGCNQFTLQANLGMGELAEVVDILTNPNRLDDFMNPNMVAEQTVKNIARKLATYFFHCDPPDSKITAMWNAYKTSYNANRFDITAMMRELLKQGTIHCSGPILKRPLHLAVSAVRATGSQITDPGDEDTSDTLIGGFLQSAGHIPYFWPAPNGYAPGCDKDYWGANQLTRENLGAAMFNIAPPYLINGVNSLAASQAVLGAASSQAVVDLLDSVMFGGFMPTFDKTRIKQYMDSTIDIFARVEALGLTIGSPGFQWY